MDQFVGQLVFPSSLPSNVGIHDGHIVELQNTEVTMPGQILSIPSEGFPIYDAPNSRGDLVITFQVIFPEILSPSQKVKVKDILKK